jgi:hypothetical protein
VRREFRAIPQQSIPEAQSGEKWDAAPEPIATDFANFYKWLVAKKKVSNKSRSSKSASFQIPEPIIRPFSFGKKLLDETENPPEVSNVPRDHVRRVICIFALLK